MSIENLEEYALEKNPNMDLARWRFMLSLPENKNNTTIRTQLLECIRAGDLAPFYEYTCLKLRWSVDKSLLSSMKAANLEKLQQLDHEIEEAEMNFGQMEVREAYLKKAEYLCRIGDKEAAETAFRLTYEKTTALGQRLDIVLNLIRLGLFYMDHDLIKRNLDKANYLIEEGGDWDRRNRLKVYQGTYALSVRDFKQASELFLSTLTTFAAYELLDYNTFIRYTVYVSMVVLPRQDLCDRVIRDPELQQGFHAVEDVKNFLVSLHKCQYANFFSNLADVESRLRSDFFWNPHYHFYVREMRLIAYAQMLASYRSLALNYMAERFGVDVEFIEKELRTFIAAGRLYAKIDRVRGIVETNRPDSKNYQYQCAIKQGDVLLNRIQKLSRAVDK